MLRKLGRASVAAAVLTAGLSGTNAYAQEQERNPSNPAAQDEVRSPEKQRLPGQPVHGTGCALSASIACRLARGDGLLAAVVGAKGYLHRALAAAAPLGVGRGPVRHDVAADATDPVVVVAGPYRVDAQRLEMAQVLAVLVGQFGLDTVPGDQRP